MHADKTEDGQDRQDKDLNLMKDVHCSPHAIVFTVIHAGPSHQLFIAGLFCQKHFGVVNSRTISCLAFSHANLLAPFNKVVYIRNNRVLYLQLSGRNSPHFVKIVLFNGPQFESCSMPGFFCAEFILQLNLQLSILKRSR